MSRLEIVGNSFCNSRKTTYLCTHNNQAVGIPLDSRSAKDLAPSLHILSDCNRTYATEAKSTQLSFSESCVSFCFLELCVIDYWLTRFKRTYSILYFHSTSLFHTYG